jgi:hypothetical protein
MAVGEDDLVAGGDGVPGDGLGDLAGSDHSDPPDKTPYTRASGLVSRTVPTLPGRVTSVTAAL